MAVVLPVDVRVNVMDVVIDEERVELAVVVREVVIVENSVNVALVVTLDVIEMV